MKVHLGLDIGSISINAVVMNMRREILEDHYLHIHGKPFHTLLGFQRFHTA